MRVLQVDLGSPATGADGIPVAIASLTAPLLELGIESTLEKTSLQGLRRSLADAADVRERLRRERFDLVHLHSAFRPAHVRLAAGLRRLGLGYVVSPRSALAGPALRRDAARKRLWIGVFERRYLSRAARVVCLSAVEAEDVGRVAPRARTEVVPNAAPATGVELERAPAGAPSLVTLARYDVRQKGLDRLVEIARRCPAVTFSVYGDRDRNETAAVDQLLAALPANVRFLPPVGPREKAEILAGATAYFAPSRWEGLSMSILEALRAGVPCITSAYAARTLGRAAEHVLVLPDEVLDGDPAGAARLLVQALGDERRLAELGAAGPRAVAREFDPSAVAERLAAVYRASAPPPAV